MPLRDYDAGVWHGFVPGVGPGQAYGYRAAGPYDPARGLRCNPAKLLLDPYARAISGEVAFGPEVLRLRGRQPGRAERARLGRAHAAQPGRGRGVPVDRRRPAPAPLLRHDHLRGARQGVHHAPPRRARPHCAAPTPGSAHEAAVGYLAGLGVTAVELLPVHQNVPGELPAPARADELLGLQHDRLLRAAPRLLRGGAGRAARRPGRRVQGHGGRPARGGPRGAPRRRLQPHRRGRPHGPHALLPRPGQPRVLPARPRRPQPVRRHHRLRQLAQRRGYP